MIVTNAVVSIMHGYVMVSVSHIAFLTCMHLADNIHLKYPSTNEK